MQAERHFGDFVEQQGAVLRLLEFSGLRLLRTGERAFFVAEQRGFEQAVGNRRAVDGDKGAVFTGRVMMDVTGDDFLADAGFAGQQNGRVGLRNARGERKEVTAGGIAGNDAFVVQGIGQTVTRHVFKQRLRFEGLEQKVAGAAAHRLDGAVNVGEGGHQHHRQMRQALADFLQQGDAVHRHHAHVADHQRDGLLRQQFQRFLAATGGNNGFSGEFERIADRLAQIGIVFDDQDGEFCRCFHDLVHCSSVTHR